MGIFSKAKSFLGTAVGAGAGFLIGGPAGAAIGGGLGLMNDVSTQAQNKANQKAIDRANSYDMYAWDLQNQYNNPVHQMERLKAAGLNPNLVYGSGNVSGNSTGIANSNGSASITASGLEKTLPMMQGYANLNNTLAQNELLNYQMGQTKAQTAHTIAETKNLNNFIDGTGRSTYEPVISKNMNSLYDTGKKVGEEIYNSVRDTYNSASDWFSSKDRWWNSL